MILVENNLSLLWFQKHKKPLISNNSKYLKVGMRKKENKKSLSTLENVDKLDKKIFLIHSLCTGENVK